MTYCCNLCRQPLDDEKFGAALHSLHMGRVERAVAEALARAKGFHVPVDRLAVSAYGVSHGLPTEVALMRIRGIVHGLRQKVSRAGYAIEHEHGSGYRLRRIGQRMATEAPVPGYKIITIR